jgi:hypothetical protein
MKAIKDYLWGIFVLSLWILPITFTAKVLWTVIKFVWSLW